MYSIEKAFETVSERFCKSHHYKNVELTDAMVTEICKVKSLVNMGFINTKQLLLDFFKAMTQWENFANKKLIIMK